MGLELPEFDPCPFCDNIAGRPSSSGTVCAPIAETDQTFAFVVPRAISRGHSLVIPKRHSPTLFDLTDDEAVALISASRRLAGALMAAFEPDGLTLVQNNGLASEQSVPHLHFHLIPRWHGQSRFDPPGDRLPLEERVELADLIQQHL
ncbi:MAG: HIT domain-containing protein [Dehalococcoidia bacterium]|nr:HIT domain-containing protein [Dehalococcoidia bacterium]